MSGKARKNTRERRACFETAGGVLWFVSPWCSQYRYL